MKQAFAHAKTLIADADQRAAMSWWNSLPGGKKRYLKEHIKLTNPQAIGRFWLASLKKGEANHESN